MWISTRRALVAAVTMIPVVASSGVADAHGSRGRTPIAWSISTSVSNYTDCPVAAPAEVDCVGTQVYVELRHKWVGRTRITSSTAAVSNFVVHFHADATFEIDESPFATGSGPVSLRFRQLSALRMSGTVPMSDGSTVVLGVRLAGTGPVNEYDDSGTGPDPDCPSGASEYTFSGAWRDAEVTGTIIVDGTPLDPTSAVGSPFILSERGRGTCLP